MVSDEKVAEIRERVDLVALVGEHVTLKRSGASFKGLCPFHAERTPSFFVHPARRFFHCFGCGASGDAIAFVMKLEGRSFPEALRALAERAGIALEPEDPRHESAARAARLEHERLHAAVEAAAGYFVRMLAEHPLGAMARAELERRGIRPDVAATYRLGYAPHGWDNLVRHLGERGIAPRDAELAGLIVPRREGRGHYDRFRHRLVFPIADTAGRIVAFSGRALPSPPTEPMREGGDPPAKYVNSPEGPLYRKGELLFGLHEARVELRRQGSALLCEGNFDVLALHQAGYRNVVAPLGTALTAQQARLLRRYVSRVTLVFDGDAAGRKAVAAAHPLLAAEALAAEVAVLPPGEDPDSLLRSKGPDAVRAVVAAATPIVEHLIESAAAQAGADPAARARAIESLGPVLAAVPNPVEARLWVERIAQAFQVHDLQAVRAQLRRGVRTQAGPRPAPARGRAAPEPPSDPAEAAWNAVDQTEKDAVLACLDHPPLLASNEARILEELLTNGDLRVILRSAARMVETCGAVDATALLASVGAGPARTWLEGRLSVQTFDEAGARRFLAAAVLRLRRRRIEREVRALEPEIKAALRAGDQERATELMRRRDELYRSARSKG